jgi:hypothetical protein
MNKSICKGCCRFAENKEPSEERWLCARKVTMKDSFLIPLHKYLHQDEMTPITLSRETPPAWCDFAAEQVIIDANEDCGVEAFDSTELTLDR